jgi:diguanylate cyclase (GGDEF)-like protein
MACSVATDRVIRLGLLVDWLEDDYQNIVLRGAVEAARERGVGLTCFAGGSLGPPQNGSKAGSRFGAPRNAVFGLANSRNVDGLMVLSGTLANNVGRQELLRFCDAYRPLPMCSIAVALPTMPSVLVDNAAGMRAAIVHLIVDHKLERIAFLRGPPANDDAERRYRIYCNVLSEYGLPVDPRLVVSGDFQRASGVLAVRELYENRRMKVDAIVAASDYMALGAIEEATVRGIRVPEDLAIVGFDDVEEASCSNPPLTTVRQPLLDQGRWAVEVLLDLIRGRPTPDRVQLHTEFVRRSSCGCPRGDVETAVFAQARQRLAARRWARALAETGEALLSTPDVPGLAKTVAEQLPALGIESGYLALYENGERPSPESRLILGYDRTEAVIDGRIFRSDDLIPDDLAAAHPRPYVIEPLVFKDEELGFAVLELGPTEGVIYEALRDQVSGALKSALLLEQVVQSDRERRRLLRYIVSATPDMHRMQALDELFQTILVRVTELFGSGEGPPSEPERRGKARRIEGFLAAVDDDSELTVRASTDRFAAKRSVDECLPPDLAAALRESLRTGEIRVVDDSTLVPLRVSELPLGVIYLDYPIRSDADVELLKVFSNQATAAVRNAQLYEMAALDPLTGAYARRFFSDWLHREVRTAFRTRHDLSLLMVDVDNMKRINDAAGHLLGDQALSLTAKALRQATREGDVVGRYGGDEFSVVLPHTDAEGAALVAERALKLIESRTLQGPNGECITVHCSIGRSTLVPHDFSLNDGQRAAFPEYFREVGIGLIKRADEALYKAKRNGGRTCESGATASWPPLAS